jgi:phosphoribosyl-AMP cyclohydrolase / phosphoribosyl-ATP pyrophosphohydrolase
MTTTIQFSKYDKGLVPAIIQDAITKNVLMLGFMNEAAYTQTVQEKKVTFFSRSKNRLWTKGEESGNFLFVKTIALDCDNDTLLIQVNPVGAVCHMGSDTCWNEKNELPFLQQLEATIAQRQTNLNDESYTASLFKKGINKIAQKVGEEAIEVVIEAKDNNDDLFLNESADLLFHYLILLRAKGKSLDDVISVLKTRQK